MLGQRSCSSAVFSHRLVRFPGCCCTVHPSGWIAEAWGNFLGPFLEGIWDAMPRWSGRGAGCTCTGGFEPTLSWCQFSSLKEDGFTLWGCASGSGTLRLSCVSLELQPGIIWWYLGCDCSYCKCRGQIKRLLCIRGYQQKLQQEIQVRSLHLKRQKHVLEHFSVEYYSFTPWATHRGHS